MLLKRMTRHLGVSGFLSALLLTTMTLEAGIPIYEAKVNKDRTSIRAGVGRTFYSVGSLSAGQKVKVYKAVYGWYRIAPPAGVFSFVRKDGIQLNGKIGVAKRDGLRVTAASIEGPGGSYRRQLDLKKGARIEIVEEAGGYYKIKPPKGAFVYLPPDSISKIDTLVKKETKPVITPDKKEAKAEDEIIEVVVSGSGVAKEKIIQAGADTKENNPLKIKVGAGQNQQAKEADPVDKVKTQMAEADRLAKEKADKLAAAKAAELAKKDEAKQKAIAAAEVAEKRFREVLLLEVEDQPLLEVKAQIKSVLIMEALPYKEKRLMQIRLAQAEKNMKLQNLIATIKEAKTSVKKEEKEVIEPATPTYDFVGRLTISSVFSNASGPRFYRMVDTGGTTIGYISKEGNENLGHMVGKVVGVVGASAVEPEMRIKLIQVNKIEVFGAMSTMSATGASREAVASFDE